MRLLAAGAICGAIALLVAPARAVDPPPIIPARLEFRPVPGCPPESFLRAEFARRLGHDPFVEVAALRVVATTARTRGRLSGLLELYDSTDKLIWERPISPAPDCRQVVLEMAGALAVRLDPIIYPSDVPLPAPSPPEEPPPRDVPPAAVPVPAPAPVPVPVPAPAPAPIMGRMVVGLSSQLVIGGTGPTVGFVAHLGRRWSDLSPGMDLSLGLEFRYDAPSSAVLDSRPWMTAQKRLMVGSLVSCLHGRGLFGCALVSSGALLLTLENVHDPQPDRQVNVMGYVGVGARLGFEQPINPWLAVHGYVDGLLALHPLPLRLTGHSIDLGTSGVSFPLSGAAGVSLVVYFGGSR